MPGVDVTSLERLRDVANEDPEFCLTARFWDTVLRLDVGDAAYVIRIRDAQIIDLDELVDLAKRRSESRIIVSAPAEDWEELLRPVPRPFYQDLWGATSHHGFEVSGDLEEFSQYYPAVGRMLDLLRTVVNEGTPEGRTNGSV